MAKSWSEINAAVLAKVDVRTEYERLPGMEITGRQPNHTGWLACWALDRPHGNSPSAAINVGDGPLRGRYIDRGGHNDSLSFWDAMVKFGDYKDWMEACRHYAKQVGLSRILPKDREERPEDAFTWVDVPHFAIIVRGLVKAYPGMTAEALQLCGARIATYPKKSSQPRYVVALPVYGPLGIEGGARGYSCRAADGGLIQLFQGEGKATKPTKTMNRGASGLMGRWGLAHLAEAEVVYKVEGYSGLVTMQAFIPEAMRTKHVVVANAGGSGEQWVPKEVAPLFVGKQVVLCHDCDVPGQDGAKLWTGALLGVAESVRNLVLPYEVTENRGKDLRDWVNGVE